MKRKKVLLTGATGNMGQEGLKLLYANKEKYHTIVFSLPTKADKKILSKYKNNDDVSIIWGDLTNYADVQKAVQKVDIVLHVGALVSPQADHHPKRTWRVNFEGTKNIVDAIKARPDRDKVKLLFVGSVAQMGNRTPPYHWGRVGDPLVPSVFDHYALSKIAAERYVIESGLKYWVSIRQTGILHENLFDVNDGIAYHQPLDNHLEWVTAEDSGRLLLNVCNDKVAEDFWCNVYNVGGGKMCRMTSFEFYKKIFKIIDLDFRDFEEPNWYATRNFHGQYYFDSDKLNDFLNFRRQSVNDFIKILKKNIPLKIKLLKYFPKKILQKIMRNKALKGDTPLNWIENNKVSKIKAFFGSRKKWEAIPSWENFEIGAEPAQKRLNHGYNENKSDAEFTIEDLKKAAKFRGGKCLSEQMEQGDLQTKLEWKCAHNHRFEASPYLVLKTGHWCPECMKTPWNFDEQAKFNKFLAQIWYLDHKIQEKNINK